MPDFYVIDQPICPRCLGTGKYQHLPIDPETPCAVCGGLGFIVDREESQDNDAVDTESPQ